MMHFSSFVTAGLFALAAAQSEVTSTTTSTTLAVVTTTSLSPATSAASAITDCLKTCDAADVDCRAQCITVPSPDVIQVNQTQACIAACPQGDGTADANTAYSDCLQGCIARFYLSTGTAAPAASTPVETASTTATATATATATTTATTETGSETTSQTTEPVLSTVTSDSTTFTTTLDQTTRTTDEQATTTESTPSATSDPASDADMRFTPAASSLALIGFLAAFLVM